MRIDVVVARYKEDISWLNDSIFSDLNVFVYNKHHEGELTLPNIGREAHTYIHHIVQNYDNLAEVTAFLQGDPFGHTDRSDFWDHIRNLKNATKFTPISHHNPGLNCDFNGSPHHTGLPLKSDFQFLFNREPKSDKIVFYGGAMFAVPKHLILAHSLDFYTKLLARLVDPNEPKERLKQNPALGYTLERLWPLIFGEPEAI